MPRESIREELRITAIAVIGDVRVVVPPGVAVELDGISLLGDKRCRVGELPAPPPGAPRVRVTAYAVMGDVTVMSAPLSAPLTVSGPRWNVSEGPRTQAAHSPRGTPTGGLDHRVEHGDVWIDDG